MRYFTNNPLERLMMQKPKAVREDSPPDAAKEHFCYGCKRFGPVSYTHLTLPTKA